MESDEPEIEGFLRGLQEGGEGAGTGAFGLDPHRAVELLREQGQLGENALLFLLRYLYEHTNGARLRFRRSSFGVEVCYPQGFGIPQRDTHRILAEGAFAAHHLKLVFSDSKVRVGDGSLFGGIDSFDSLKTPVEKRLQRFPIDGLLERGVHVSSWLSLQAEEGRLELEPDFSGLVEWVVCGISFFEHWEPPVRLVVYDDGLRCDLSLSRVPEGERKSGWLLKAKGFLHQHLASGLRAQQAIRLDEGFLDSELETVLSLLDYMVNLPEEDPLRNSALDRIHFRDVFEQYWSLGELLRFDREDRGILVVPAVPSDCPKERVGRLPVLLWRGDTKRFGNPVFKRLSSGAGYLYSLRRGEESETRNDAILGQLEWEHGTLALRPLGPREARCEIELVGLRRNSETRHLDPPAPSRLRLRWRSRDELASWNTDQAFQRELRCRVVELVERCFQELESPPEWLLGLLRWADGITDLSGFPNLAGEPIFAAVDGSGHSFSELKKLEVVPVLEDHSASLPKVLPCPLILWSDPLLERLGLPVREVRSEVRRAYWQEQGREKWIARYQPCRPGESELFPGVSWTVMGEKWLLGKGAGGSGSLVIWREGRPLGRSSCPQVGENRILLYLDDEFPADDYWAGPAPAALRDLKENLPELQE